MPIVIALYLITGIFALWIECIKIIKTHHISFGSFCFAFFSVFCCIIPGLTLWDGDLSRCRNHSEWYAFITYLLTLVVYISAYVGYYLGNASSKPKYRPNHLINDKGDKNITLFANILLIISIISLYLYSSGYGGIVETMLQGGTIRSSITKSSNSFTFFKHLIPVSIIASLLLYTQLFIKKRKQLIVWNIIALILSFIISLIYITANDGRALAGIYILLFIIISLKYKFEIKHSSFKKMMINSILICSIIFVLIIESENIFNIFRERDIISNENSALDVILSEFNFIYVGLYTSVKYILDSGSFLISNDVINGIFAWLPTSLKPIILDDVWDYNTHLINDGGYGQSPVNIVGQSFYDLGFFGIFIIPFLYTLILGKLDNFFNNNYNTVGLVFFTTLAFYLGKAMAYFSLYNIMMNIFFIVLSWYIYKLIISKL